MLRVPREGKSVSEYDEEAAGESLRKAVELLPDDGADEGSEAAQRDVQVAVSRLEIVHAATLEGLKESKQKMADHQEVGRGPACG
jgi:hypothetical protein